ncbi:hypothetical protein EPO05_07065, partial [Patescibacteria group bacterium]
MASIKKSTRKNPKQDLSAFELSELTKRCQYVPVPEPLQAFAASAQRSEASSDDSGRGECPPQLTGGESTEAHIKVLPDAVALNKFFFPSTGQTLLVTEVSS